MLARCLRVTERQPASYSLDEANQARTLRYGFDASGSLRCMRPVIEGRTAQRLKAYAGLTLWIRFARMST